MSDKYSFSSITGLLITAYQAKQWLVCLKKKEKKRRRTYQKTVDHYSVRPWYSIQLHMQFAILFLFLPFRRKCFFNFGSVVFAKHCWSVVIKLCNFVGHKVCWLSNVYFWLTYKRAFTIWYIFKKKNIFSRPFITI